MYSLQSLNEIHVELVHCLRQYIVFREEILRFLILEIIFEVNFLGFKNAKQILEIFSTETDFFC